jgi:hypothetical protein
LLTIRGLANVMDQFDRASVFVRDFRPCLRDTIDRAIVVFGDAMAGNERIYDYDVDLPLADFSFQLVDHRSGDDDLVPKFFRDDDGRFATAADEKPPLDLARINIVVQENCSDAPFNLLERIFPVPHPDGKMLRSWHTEQIAPGGH